MKISHAPVLVLALALTLAGCGSVEQTGSAAAQSVPTGGPVTLTDARGEQLTLDSPATDVVGLEWGVVENLVSLGVMPAGVADVKGYGNWVKAAPLAKDVQDVGTRREPSIDALVALDPDLVVATTDLPANLVEQIEQFVPVLLVRAASAEQPVQQMRDNLLLVAQAVDRTQQAETLLADLDDALAAGAREIEQAGRTGRGFVLADGYLEGSSVSIRIFTAGSLAGAVGEKLGLDNVWTGEGDPDYGLDQTDVEGLTALGDIDFLYYANDGAGGDPFAEGLTGNAIWNALPAVSGGYLHRLEDGIWMFGGPLSMEQFIDAAVEAVIA